METRPSRPSSARTESSKSRGASASASASSSSSMKRRQSLPGLKMDSSRAQYILGFTNTKRVDASSNVEFKAALDKALMEQMQRLSLKQKKAEKDQKLALKAAADNSLKGKKAIVHKKWDQMGSKIAQHHIEFVTLHEAYQFMVQKCNNDEQRRNLMALRRNTTIPEMGSIPETDDDIQEENEGEDETEEIQETESSYIM